MVIDGIRRSPIWRYATVTAMMKSTANGTPDESPSFEEPDDGKLSRPVLKWRGEGRPSSRP
jgi:hypothetical protein